MNRKINRKIHFLLLMLLFLVFSISVKSQMNGGLFLLPDNFYAQMLNPAFMRNDDGRILAFPGFGGFSFRNTANFRFTDIIYTQASGETVFDFNRISQNGNTLNSGSVYLEMPLFYMAVPVKKGMFSFYYKEKMHSSVHFPGTSLLWFEHGNFPDKFRNYNTGEIDFRFHGTHELAAGITRIVNNKIKVGIRGKLVFGAGFFEANNVNYGIYTSETGHQVLLTSGGTGKMALKFPVEITKTQKINSIPLEQPVKNYILNFSSPGIATDIGISIDFDKNNQFSFAATDIGFVYFGSNYRNFTLNGNYLFQGMNIADVIQSRDDDEYISPLDLMLTTKDSIRNVYRPDYTNGFFFSGLSPKIFLQYSHKYNQTFTAGFGNQTIFQKGYWLNTFSVNAQYANGGLSTIANLSLYNFHSLTFGGGIQLTNKSSQFFVFTDNLLAIYHPADQKSFSLTVGMNFLFDHDLSALKKKAPVRKGVISPGRPFYKRYN